MDISIRRGTRDDAPTAADLWLRAREAAAGTIPEPIHTAEEVRGWFASHVVAECELWIAEGDLGTPVALLVLENDWVDQLYVEPALTGRGIGGRLIDLAKHQRPQGLTLWTFASNTGAQRFYERHGFVEKKRTDGRDNEERSPDIRFAWVP